MEASELETADASWIRAATRKLQDRWVQVLLAILVGILLMVASGFALAPKKAPPAKDPKFLYCPKCEYEQRYDAKHEGEPCMRCREEPVGKLIGIAESHKVVGKKSPWKWVYLSIAFEAIATTGVVVFLLSRKTRAPESTYYVFGCPHCGQRLRFRSVSLGGLGQCSRCKRPVRFPTAEHAVLEEDLMREEQQRLESEHEEDDEEE